MALSDQLTKLAERAKELEEHAATARNQAKSDLQREVDQARTAAQAQSDALRRSAEASKGHISAWWDSVERSWNEHLAAVKKNMSDKRAEHDLDKARRSADQADDDAGFAIDFAYAAIEEAEFAVLDAALARMEADDLASSAR